MRSFEPELSSAPPFKIAHVERIAFSINAALVGRLAGRLTLTTSLSLQRSISFVINLAPEMSPASS